MKRKDRSNVLIRSIGGYWLSSLNHFDLCFSVENGNDQLCAFLLTIIESEKYDKFLQIQWIEQLQQKYSDVDQVKIRRMEKNVRSLFNRISSKRFNVPNGSTINIQFVYNFSSILL